MLVDSHCHLDFPTFDTERDAVIARARAAGVDRLVTIGTTIARHAVLQAIAERHAEVFFTVGTHMLVETDAPFLAPQPVRGKRNEPAYVVHTASVLAELKGMPLAAFAAATSRNAAALFTGMPPLDPPA